MGTKGGATGRASGRSAAGGSDQTVGWSFAGGLIGLLTLFAGVALLFTGRYPRGVFDFLLGMHRWVLRVTAYAALMTDHYPPFRIDLGGSEPPEPAVHEVTTGQPVLAVSKPGVGWTTGRVVTVVLGSLLVVAALGTAVGGTTLLVADRAGRDADGFLGTDVQTLSTSGYALVLDPARAARRPGRPRSGVGPRSGPGDREQPNRRVRRYRTGLGRQRLPGRRRTQPTGRRALRAPDHAADAARGRPGHPAATAAVLVGFSLRYRHPADHLDRDRGRWAIVVMNADGTRPLTATVSAGVTAPALHWVWTALFWAVGPLLILGAVLIGLALPRRRVDTPPPPLVTV